MTQYRFGLLILLMMNSLPRLALADAPSHKNPVYVPCKDDTAKQKIRSEELRTLFKGDQDDRKDWEHLNEAAMQEMAVRDRERRERIGAIFGEGCFKTAEDYMEAAIVFQHGDAADHYFQTFLWSKRAVELGRPEQKQMMAYGLDRYLVMSGNKQLFGSQSTKIDSCWCLQQVEPSVPEELRFKYTGVPLVRQLEELKDLNRGTQCPMVQCKRELKPTPKGTIAGFW